jgi:hypothetical protein
MEVMEQKYVVGWVFEKVAVEEKARCARVCRVWREAAELIDVGGVVERAVAVVRRMSDWEEEEERKKEAAAVVKEAGEAWVRMYERAWAKEAVRARHEEVVEVLCASASARVVEAAVERQWEWQGRAQVDGERLWVAAVASDSEEAMGVLKRKMEEGKVVVEDGSGVLVEALYGVGTRARGVRAVLEAVAIESDDDYFLMDEVIRHAGSREVVEAVVEDGRVRSNVVFADLLRYVYAGERLSNTRRCAEVQCAYTMLEVVVRSVTLDVQRFVEEEREEGNEVILNLLAAEVERRGLQPPRKRRRGCGGVNKAIKQ